MFRVLIFISFCVLAIGASDTLNMLPATPLTGPLPVYKSALVAQPTHVEVHEPTLAKVGDVVETVPAAVSHQSSTIVHSTAQRRTPLVIPAVRSYNVPAIRTYSASIAPVPLLRALPLGLGGSAPTFVHHNQNPIHVRSFATSPLYRSIGFSYGHRLLLTEPTRYCERPQFSLQPVVNLTTSNSNTNSVVSS